VHRRQESRHVETVTPRPIAHTRSAAAIELSTVPSISKRKAANFLPANMGLLDAGLGRRRQQP
jgi:hypothetical protein